MGIVYEGRDPNLDRRVAIKTVKVESLSEQAEFEYEARFRTEARSAARLQHPNIVSVYDSDRDGDTAFLVMEYIHGEDLKHHLDRGVRYSLEQSLKMIRDLLSALDYAHKQGIVHRDVKPANLMLERGGRVKLTDFGVARMQDSDATRTQGNIIGTLKYMAPEQVQGLQTDSRADLFSAGVVLYQLLTDKRPFDGDNDFSIIHQIIGHKPPPPSSINRRLPAAIDEVMELALAKDRDQRFATARDFAIALQSAVRRAEDTTVVPPADPLKQVDASGASPQEPRLIVGAESTHSTATQEVELICWKDIKDATDARAFEAFLEKFPAGIYADLARRRLRRLTDVPTSPDQTLLTGLGAGQVMNPARVLVEPKSNEVPPETASEPAQQASVMKRPMAILGLVGAVSIAAWVLFLMTGKGPEAVESPLAAVAAEPPASSVVAAAESKAADAAVADVDAKPVAVVSPTVSAVQVKASAPKMPGVAKPRTVTSSAPVIEASRSASAQAAIPVAQEEPRVAIAPVALVPAANPVDACKDRVFLSREFCLASACEKTAARHHPLCVAWRDDKRLREESKIRQGP